MHARTTQAALTTTNVDIHTACTQRHTHRRNTHTHTTHVDTLADSYARTRSTHTRATHVRLSPSETHATDTLTPHPHNMYMDALHHSRACSHMQHPRTHKHTSTRSYPLFYAHGHHSTRTPYLWERLLTGANARSRHARRTTRAHTGHTASTRNGPCSEVHVQCILL